MINILIMLLIIFFFMCIMKIPFHINFVMSNSGLEFNGYFKVTWMRIPLFKHNISHRENKKVKKEHKKLRDNKKPEWNLKRFLKIFNLFVEVLPYFQKICYAFISALSLEKLVVHLNIGMDSPVDTAQVTGILWSISSWINPYPNMAIYIQPKFMKPRFDGKIELVLNLKLLWIVMRLLNLITKKPVRNLIREIRT
ncbi:MAG: DUF2953 domain-containing protein [Methanobacterium sp.]|nr:DUF2953 domain-containing protein [Methanobacterium sp.]